MGGAPALSGFTQRTALSALFFDNRYSNICCKGRVHGVVFVTAEKEKASFAAKLISRAAPLSVLTLGSKITGFFREALVASSFGVGPVTDSFSYSSALPSLFMNSFGGVNGPVYTAAVTVCTSKNDGEASSSTTLSCVTTVVLFASTLTSFFIYMFADVIISTMAPGLRFGSSGYDLATVQLRILAPCAVISGALGLGLGRLASAGCLSVPALCPVLSSFMTVILLLFLPYKSSSTDIQEMLGGCSLALGMVLGAGVQLLVIAMCKFRLHLKKPKFMCRASTITEPGTYSVIQVLFTSCVTSGVLQIAVYTDLFFSSFIPEAAAGLGYANLLAMAPIGIISSSLLVCGWALLLI